MAKHKKLSLGKLIVVLKRTDFCLALKRTGSAKVVIAVPYQTHASKRRPASPMPALIAGEKLVIDLHLI